MIREGKRKSLHIAAGAIPVALIYMPWDIALISLTLLTLLNVLLDVGKYKVVFLGRAYQYLVGDILREHERKGGLTGATYFFLSLCLSYILFHLFLALPVQNIAVIYTGFMIGDAAAALVGKNFGRIHLCNAKSLEGSLSFCIASLGATFWMVDSIYFPVWSAAALSVTELIWVKLDDNFFVPLIVLAVSALLFPFG